MKSFLVAFGLSAALVVSAPGYAQQPAPKITTLQKSPVSGQPEKEFILLSIEWPAETSTAAHTHFGDEYGTVMEGSYSVKQGDGEWKTYHAGQSWHVPAGIVHESKPASAAKTINAFIVEIGKPLINPYKKP
jgi:quercetin dioxygenase-like cupin family protein